MPEDKELEELVDPYEEFTPPPPNGVVIGGRVELVPGLSEKQQVNYKHDPRLKLKPGEDMRFRKTRWVRSIVVHTTKGKPTHVKPGLGPDTDLEHRIARLWSSDHRNAGAHLSIDWDGTIGCHADLLDDAAYHAGPINEFSIGIELYQDNAGTLYAEQVDTAVFLIEWLCRRFGIQRQMLPPDFEAVHPRLKYGGPDCVGVFGHRHITTDRGPGDPGNDIFYALKAAGFMAFSFAPEISGMMPDDRQFWVPKQRELGLRGDGVPGPLTVDALREAGYPCGMWMPAEEVPTK